MEENSELNSNSFFVEDNEELSLFASWFLGLHRSKDAYFIAISTIKGQEMGMSITQTKYNDYKFSFYDSYIKFIYDGLYLILSDNSTFSDIGHSSKLMNIESFNYNPPEKCYNDFKFDLDEAGRTEFDIERQNLHHFFYKTTTKLLVLHECMHVLNGHNGYLKSINVKSGLDGVEKDLLTNLDLHTLEMDADSVALHSLIDFIISNKQKLNIPVQLNSEKGIIESVVFITFFLFYIIPGKRYCLLNEIKGSSHPSNGFRFCMMMATLATKYLNSKNAELLESTLIRTIAVYKSAINKISGENLNLDEFKIFSSEEGQKYFDEITYNWNFLRPKLEPFALKKLAPFSEKFLKKLRCNYSTFIAKINMVKFNYTSMLFSNGDLFYQLTNRDEFLSNNSHYISVDANGNEAIELTFDSLVNSIVCFGDFQHCDFDVACSSAIQLNVHYLRTKALTELYRIINEYYEGSEIIMKLHLYDWFKILYVLNNSLLNQSNSKIVTFPRSSELQKIYSFMINWNGIYIVDGQLIMNIRYNDKQIMDLLDLVLNFFSTNKDKFSID
jgi:hypothetical protein